METILLIDFNETLGESEGGVKDFKLYEGVSEFLKRQMHRLKYIVSRNEREYMEAQLSRLGLDGFFPRIFDRNNVEPDDAYYYLDNGVLKKSHAPSEPGIDYYQNPYARGGFYKDLFFTRLQMAETVQACDELNCVMVTDGTDVGIMRGNWLDEKSGIADSDPKTPCIVVSKQVRQGDWGLVERPLDLLFAGPAKPHEVYDALFQSAGNGALREINIHGQTYRFRRTGEDTGRVICCP